MKSFGNRLAELRRERNMTQYDIADRLNITAQAVSKWENDLTSPDIDTLIALSDIFDISVDELLGKEKKEALYVPEASRKDISQMVFRIKVNSADGDRVRINLPMAVVKVLVNSDLDVISGNRALDSVDFHQLIMLVEQGVIGELVSVDSADGDHIVIIVE